MAVKERPKVFIHFRSIMEDESQSIGNPEETAYVVGWLLSI